MTDSETAPSIDAMRAAAARTTAFLSSLANENRLMLLCQLAKGEKSVGELELLLDIHQPTLSQQLGVLRSEEIVQTRRDGKRIYYSIADERVLSLLTTLYTLFCPKDSAAR